MKLRYFLLGAFLFTGLPILAWGPLSLNAYFSNPYRTAYTILMLIATLLVVLFVPNMGRGSGEGEKLLKRQKLAIHYLQMVSLLLVILSPVSDRHGLLVIGNACIVRPIGLVLTATGYFLMNWSVMALGKQFSTDVTIQKGHKLITTGPYRLVRHPRYLGIIVFLTGIALTFRSLLSLMFAGLTVAVVLWRIWDEEKLMRETFPAEWDAYVKRTRRLVPFLF